MNEKLEEGDYGSHPKINQGLKTEVEAIKEDQLKFRDFEGWVPLSEVRFIAKNDVKFVD